ncbi:hypothetical protein SDC9_119640 [bioreactor metagenome]|uniref:Uncharacterized protein n=1 Tax=bioreactor metagenome TaxID=1076179 RepID=A0A645C9I0_9ZZZZ
MLLFGKKRIDSFSKNQVEITCSKNELRKINRDILVEKQTVCLGFENSHRLRLPGLKDSTGGRVSNTVHGECETLILWKDK